MYFVSLVMPIWRQPQTLDASLRPRQAGRMGSHGLCRPPWLQVVKSHRSIERKAVLQMAAVSNRPLLLSLTDEGVSLHTLPDMSLKCLALRSKGGSAFAWHEERQLLAVAVKRRVRRRIVAPRRRAAPPHAPHPLDCSTATDLRTDG